MRLSSGILLLDKEKKFLLQHRNKNIKRFPNYWAFFGGKIEKEESSEEAVRRESKEELGIKLHDLKLVGKFKSNQRKEIQYIFIAPLVLSLKNLRNQQKEGQGLKKFSFSEVRKLKIPRFEKTILKDLFRKNLIG